MAKMLFQLSDETKVVVSLLRDLKEGETCPYVKIQASLGYPNLEPCRGAIGSARHVLLRDPGYVYEAVHKVGIRRLNDPEKVKKMHKTVGQGKGIAKRSREVSLTIDWTKLSPEETQEALALQTIGGVMGEITKTKNIEKVQHLLPPPAKDPIGLPPAKALDIIKSILLKD